MKLFYCYSMPLKNYLMDNGFRFETRALHPKSKKEFWIFVNDEKLGEILKEWKTNNPNKQ